MKRLSRWTISLILVAMMAAFGAPAAAQGDDTVRAVLFYSPTCPHCHTVMTEVIPPLEDQYGEQLVVVNINTTSPQGNALWQAAVTLYNPNPVGVPTLILGEHVMVGSREIPEQFPGYIEQYLATGGVDWPDLPGIEEAVGTVPEPASRPSLAERFTRDLAGNILAVVVLIGLVATLVAVVRPRAWQPALAERFAPWGMLVLIAIGLVAASYLAYVETTGSEAICGPVGDCNTVQQSEFALLFGFLPVAVLGVLGYLAILFGYVYARWIQGPMAEVVPGLVFLMAIFGLLFSIFLTFLEPFVIGASCAWCLTSAVAMMAITLLTAGPGWAVLQGGSTKRQATRRKS